MENQSNSPIQTLMAKGVDICRPESVLIGDEVDPDRISKGVTLYPGCRIFGESTLILPGTRLGYEAPATIENCQIGPSVELKGGFFKNAVFLKGAGMGSGAHVREGTILEEKANGAHTVGLKQTILFPFVTLGSLINFCDCLMAGGTSTKDHSEVGSSYIHFNYTPNQDKATPSLLGDVPKGVMLNQHPIFLGGQGGLVGPCRMAYGTIIAAGSIYRKDEFKPDRLLADGGARRARMPYTPGLYRNVKRIVVNNVVYIANLMALRQWYGQVRAQFISKDFPQPLLNGLKEKLDMGIHERIQRLKAFCLKMPESAERYAESAGDHASESLLRQKKELYGQASELASFFKDACGRDGEARWRDPFLEAIGTGIGEKGRSYVPVMKSLEGKDADIGVQWLSGIVTKIGSEALEMLPSMGTADI